MLLRMGCPPSLGRCAAAAGSFEWFCCRTSRVGNFSLGGGMKELRM